MNALVISAPLAPLFGALLAALGGTRLGNKGAHRATILSVLWAFVASVIIAREVIGGSVVINFDWYVWLRVGDVALGAGFLVDNLTAMMMIVVSFVSLMVHIYAIGYMAGDPGYRRFFACISMFTFAMLMLVMANNFLQLFFGWEAVGLVSYLLIGFWFKKASAVRANLKAFLVNRVGDLGFLLGIALILAAFGTLDYGEVFAAAQTRRGMRRGKNPGFRFAAGLGCSGNCHLFVIRLSDGKIGAVSAMSGCRIFNMPAAAQSQNRGGRIATNNNPPPPTQDG